ncbi:MAG: hypothetical protein J6B37_05940 [Clostridia bacterium]|nr:hypothetical protein [Clostridia bacterium]
MVKSKKLLSLFLAVVMILSTFAVMASAYTMGADIADGINYKYTVEKVGTVPETAAGSAEWSADNIYAVSIWMKASKGVDVMTAPLHYNKTLFAPIMLSDGECTYPVGAGMDQDSYYTDMGEGAVYAYSLGDYMNNTGMYKANGTTATTKALAKCIGLGNSNSAGVSVISELVSPDHPLYNKWGAGLSDTTGVLYVNLNVATKAKTAYLNTIEGVNYSTDWNKMFTFYFETLPGVTDADVVGAEFGVFTPDCFTLDGNFDATGSAYYVGATSYASEVPKFNVSGNAVVEASGPEFPATSIVNPLKGQIRFHSNDAGEYAGSYDVRALAKITGTDFAATFTDEATAKEMITEVGFVFAAGSNVAAPSAADVMSVVESGATVNGLTKKPVNFISRSASLFGEGNYGFSCVVTDMTDDDYDNSLVAVAFIAYDSDGDSDGDGKPEAADAYAYYPAAQTVSFAELFDAQYDNAFPNA